MGISEKNTIEALEKAIKLIGSPIAVAAGFGFSSGTTITQWRKRGVPAERVLQLSKMTEYKITPHELDSEHYPHPDDGLPEAMRRGKAA